MLVQFKKKKKNIYIYIKMFINTLCVLLIYAMHPSKINELYIVKKVNFRRGKIRY